MKVTSYVHPVRTFLPCTGAGRHINNILLGLALHKDIDLELLFSDQWLDPQTATLSPQSPLHPLPYLTFPMKERVAERSWKLTGFPRMDTYVPETTDWLFSPMETYFPIRKCPVAITIFDIQAFEPHLLWSQSLKHRWFRYKWGRWVRRAIAHSRIVFTISEFSKQRMVTLLDADPNKVVNIGCGVEEAFFDIASIPVETIESPVDSPYVFMIGGLREKKGADCFLAVAKALHARQSDIKIVIAGSSEPKYVEAASDYPNIVLSGVVSDDDLPRLLRRSLCLLFLSLYEGFGIPPLEAMAAGVPAVVADRASLPEVVGEAGIVVNPENAYEIVDILINLEQDSRLRKNYIQRGQKHAESFVWSSCVDRVVTTLKTFS